MKTSRILSAISFGIIVFGQGCSGKFAPIGSDQDASVQGGNSGIGGSTGLTCMYQDVRYAVGTSFSSYDGCNTCSCSSDGQQILCTQRACAVGGGSSNGGSTSVGCACTGPSPASPTFQCWDGSTAGPTCVTNATGTCNWQVTTCPPQPGVGGGSGVGGNTSVTCLYNGVNYLPGQTIKSPDGCNTCSCTSSGQIACTTMACAVGGNSGIGGGSSTGCVCTGPSPASPTIQCWDGSTAGPTCVTNATGSCNWTVTTCPPQQGVGGASGAGGTTGTSGCVTAADCKGALPALCQQCSDGTSGCAHFVCNSGSCNVAYCGAADGSTCSPVALVVPNCTTGSAVLKYDASGCATGYVCP